MLGGESLPAQRLQELGLVNRIVDRGDAFNEAMKWAQKLSEGPFNAQARIKHLHRLAEIDMLRAQLAEERDSVVEAVYGPENAEGVDAFLGRRPPNFAAINGR
jgi:enoyl-CoA hydratase/carnithine racemase